MKPPRVVGAVPAELVARIPGDRFATLEDVLAWCRVAGAEVVDVVVQDEFTHDVIVRGPGAAFLCFDTT